MRGRVRQVLASLKLCSSVLLVAGCAWLDVFRPIPALDDIRPERVELTSAKELPQGLYALGDPRELAFLVTVSSGQDLAEFVGIHKTNIAPRATLCREGRSDQSTTLPALFMVAMNRRPGSTDSLRQPPREDGRFAYLFTFPVRARGGPSGHHSWALAEYDFHRQTDDVCFYFQGGDGLYGRLHRSRDFRIPYAMIAEALARAGQPHIPLP